jgi:RNA polymerase sigma-70 factor, ECF subfamily
MPTTLPNPTGAPTGVRPSDDPPSATEQFRRLASESLDRAYRLAGLILRDQHEAEDVTQEALLRAWQAARTLRDPAAFEAWFDRILVNVCRDRLRRRSRVRFIALDAAGSTHPAADPFRELFDQDELLRALDSIDEDLRIVLLLHYWADLTLETVADRVGWPVGTVKSRLHRGLTQMRRHISGHDEAEALR